MAFELDVPKYDENNYAMINLCYQNVININSVLFSLCNNSDQQKSLKKFNVQ